MPQNIIVGDGGSCVEGECVKGVWTGRVRGLRGHESRDILRFIQRGRPLTSSVLLT